jgi:hypothetical protein
MHPVALAAAAGSGAHQQHGSSPLLMAVIAASQLMAAIGAAAGHVLDEAAGQAVSVKEGTFGDEQGAVGLERGRGLRRS